MIVFVSGAAGLIGGALVKNLTDHGHGVIALVHTETAIRGNDNTRIETRHYVGSPPKAGEVLVARGDITLSSLGLKSDHLEAMQSQVEVVIHCAALVRFEAEFEELRAVNIKGTLHIAQCFQSARFVHVSTAYSCGMVDGTVPETARPAKGPFSNGYEQSKAMAEEALLAARPDAIIARPSIVVGEFESGAIRSFDAIYRAFKLIAEGRLPTLPVATEATLNFVPIDYVVRGLYAIATANHATGTIFHLVARQAFPAEEFLDLVRKTSGLERPKTVQPKRRGDQPSGLLASSLSPYLSYFTRNPEFETSNAELFLQSPAPEIDEEAMVRQIGFCVESGFINVIPKS